MLSGETFQDRLARLDANLEIANDALALIGEEHFDHLLVAIPAFRQAWSEYIAFPQEQTEIETQELSERRQTLDTLAGKISDHIAFVITHSPSGEDLTTRVNDFIFFTEINSQLSLEMVIKVLEAIDKENPSPELLDKYLHFLVTYYPLTSDTMVNGTSLFTFVAKSKNEELIKRFLDDIQSRFETESEKLLSALQILNAQNVNVALQADFLKFIVGKHPDVYPFILINEKPIFAIAAEGQDKFTISRFIDYLKKAPDPNSLAQHQQELIDAIAYLNHYYSDVAVQIDLLNYLLEQYPEVDPASRIFDKTLSHVALQLGRKEERFIPPIVATLKENIKKAKAFLAVDIFDTKQFENIDLALDALKVAKKEYHLLSEAVSEDSQLELNKENDAIKTLSLQNRDILVHFVTQYLSHEGLLTVPFLELVKDYKELSKLAENYNQAEALTILGLLNYYYDHAPAEKKHLSLETLSDYLTYLKQTDPKLIGTTPIPNTQGTSNPLIELVIKSGNLELINLYLEEVKRNIASDLQSLINVLTMLNSYNAKPEIQTDFLQFIVRTHPNIDPFILANGKTLFAIATLTKQPDVISHFVKTIRANFVGTDVYINNILNSIDWLSVHKIAPNELANLIDLLLEKYPTLHSLRTKAGAKTLFEIATELPYQQAILTFIKNIKSEPNSEQNKQDLIDALAFLNFHKNDPAIQLDVIDHLLQRYPDVNPSSGVFEKTLSQVGFELGHKNIILERTRKALTEESSDQTKNLLHLLTLLTFYGDTENIKNLNIIGTVVNKNPDIDPLTPIGTRNLFQVAAKINDTASITSFVKTLKSDFNAERLSTALAWLNYYGTAPEIQKDLLKTLVEKCPNLNPAFRVAGRDIFQIAVELQDTAILTKFIHHDPSTTADFVLRDDLYKFLKERIELAKVGHYSRQELVKDLEIYNGLKHLPNLSELVSEVLEKNPEITFQGLLQETIYLFQSSFPNYKPVDPTLIETIRNEYTTYDNSAWESYVILPISPTRFIKLPWKSLPEGAELGSGAYGEVKRLEIDFTQIDDPEAVAFLKNYCLETKDAEEKLHYWIARKTPLPGNNDFQEESDSINSLNARTKFELGAPSYNIGFGTVVYKKGEPPEPIIFTKIEAYGCYEETGIPKTSAVLGFMEKMKEQHNFLANVPSAKPSKPIDPQLSKDLLRAVNLRAYTLATAYKSMQGLHNVGGVHLDIALRNIFMSQDFSGKVADYGLAKFPGVNSSMSNNVETGPLTWMDPARIIKKKVSPLSDLYSYRIALFEMMAIELGVPVETLLTPPNIKPPAKPLEIATAIVAHVNAGKPLGAIMGQFIDNAYNRLAYVQDESARTRARILIDSFSHYIKAVPNVFDEDPNLIAEHRENDAENLSRALKQNFFQNLLLILDDYKQATDAGKEKTLKDTLKDFLQQIDVLDVKDKSLTTMISACATISDATDSIDSLVKSLEQSKEFLEQKEHLFNAKLKQYQDELVKAKQTVANFSMKKFNLTKQDADSFAYTTEYFDQQFKEIRSLSNPLNESQQGAIQKFSESYNDELFLQHVERVHEAKRRIETELKNELENLMETYKGLKEKAKAATKPFSRAKDFSRVDFAEALGIINRVQSIMYQLEYSYPSKAPIRQQIDKIRAELESDKLEKAARGVWTWSKLIKKKSKTAGYKDLWNEFKRNEVGGVQQKKVNQLDVEEVLTNLENFKKDHPAVEFIEKFKSTIQTLAKIFPEEIDISKPIPEIIAEIGNFDEFVQKIQSQINAFSDKAELSEEDKEVLYALKERIRVAEQALTELASTYNRVSVAYKPTSKGLFESDEDIERKTLKNILAAAAVRGDLEAAQMARHAEKGKAKGIKTLRQYLSKDSSQKLIDTIVEIQHHIPGYEPKESVDTEHTVAKTAWSKTKSAEKTPPRRERSKATSKQKREIEQEPDVVTAPRVDNSTEIELNGKIQILDTIVKDLSDVLEKTRAIRDTYQNHATLFKRPKVSESPGHIPEAPKLDKF